MEPIELLNIMLERQSLLQGNIRNKLKELEMQLELQKSFLRELKDALQYYKTRQSKNEFTEYEDPKEGVKNVLKGRSILLKGPLPLPQWKQDACKVYYKDTIDGVRSVLKKEKTRPLYRADGSCEMVPCED
jgi:hypothetical protein